MEEAAGEGDGDEKIKLKVTMSRRSQSLNNNPVSHSLREDISVFRSRLIPLSLYFFHFFASPGRCKMMAKNKNSTGRSSFSSLINAASRRALSTSSVSGLTSG